MEILKENLETLCRVIEDSNTMKMIKDDYKDGDYSMAEIVLAVIAYMEEKQD